MNLTDNIIIYIKIFMYLIKQNFYLSKLNSMKNILETI